MLQLCLSKLHLYFSKFAFLSSILFILQCFSAPSYERLRGARSAFHVFLRSSFFLCSCSFKISFLYFLFSFFIQIIIDFLYFLLIRLLYFSALLSIFLWKAARSAFSLPRLSLFLFIFKFPSVQLLTSLLILFFTIL